MTARSDNRRLAAEILVGHFAHSARLCEPDRPINKACVRDGRLGENPFHPFGKIDSFGNGRQRSEQEHDAQVGVGADQASGRLHGAENGSADAFGSRSVERVRDRCGAQEEVDEMQAGQIGKAMDVSGLPGSYLEQASKLGEPPGARSLLRVRIREPAGNVCPS